MKYKYIKLTYYASITALLGLFILTPLSGAQSPTTSLRDQVRDQVTEELSAIKNNVSKKGYVGTISAKVDATITITNLKNQARQATVTTDTAIKLAGGKDGTPADLKVGDFVIAMGDVDGQGLMTTKRLIVAAKPAEDKRQILLGTVTKISPNSLTLETLDKKTSTLKITAVTKYTNKKKNTDVKADSKVVIVADATTVLLLHLLP